MKDPIFIAWTRSFWLGIVPLLLNALDIAVMISAPGTLGPIAALIASATGADLDQVETIMRGSGVVAGLIVAHQRRGESRPYTINPRKAK